MTLNSNLYRYTYILPFYISVNERRCNGRIYMYIRNTFRGLFPAVWKGSREVAIDKVLNKVNIFDLFILISQLENTLT